MIGVVYSCSRVGRVA